MKQSEFYTKDGFLSYYGFRCGYIERKEANNKYKTMWLEHNCFHVRTGNIGVKYTTWESFDTLTEAKRYYKSIKL